jgi:hypothetical protein
MKAATMKAEPFTIEFFTLNKHTLHPSRCRLHPVLWVIENSTIAGNTN